MSKEIADRHAAASRRLILQANYELDKKSDRFQASDKGSGALAHALKAIAEDRQWRHGSHNLRRQITSLLANEFERPDLIPMQAVSDQLHDNYYEDRMHVWEIRERLDMLTQGLDFLLEARERGPNSAFVPSLEQQQAIDRLRLSEEEAAADPLIDLPPEMPPFIPPED